MLWHQQPQLKVQIKLHMFLQSFSFFYVLINIRFVDQSIFVKMLKKSYEISQYFQKLIKNNQSWMA